MTTTLDRVVTLAPTHNTPSPMPPRERQMLRGVPLAYLAGELRRPLRRTNLIFNLILPAVLYLALFKTGSSNAAMPDGNFAAWMMVGIAVYGAATASTSSAAGISAEKASGWMRTMRMTPLSGVAYVLTKVLAAMCVAVLPVIVVGLLGMVTGAHATATVWLVGLATAWVGSAVFSALGIALGLALKPDVVMHAPGLTLTGLAFLGNLFLPLNGTMLTIGRYTPMFGIATIARWPLTHGYSFHGEHSSLLWAALNTVLWFAGFVFWASRRFAKSTGRI